MAHRENSTPLYGMAALVATLLTLLLLGGCQATTGRHSHSFPADVDNTAATDARDAARLSLFLNLKSPTNQGVRMDVTAIEILSSDTGAWLPVTLQPVIIDAASIAASQLFLGRCRLTSGRYSKIRFAIEQASILKQNTDRIFLALENNMVEVNLPETLHLSPEESRSLFITWDEELSLQSPPLLQPTLSIAPDLKQMPTDLAYAACPEINTIYVIRTDKNWVCDSIAVSGSPQWLSTSDNQSRKRLYVLGSQEAAISVIELPTNTHVDTLQIPMTSKPGFMAINEQDHSGYVLDAQNDYLIRINLDSGSLENRVRLGYQPEYVSYIAGHNLLAVSSNLSQSVYLLDSTSLAEVGVVPVGGSPQGLLAWDDFLYITEGSSNTVTIYDLNLRTVHSRQNVGFYPHRLLQNDNQVYVSNRDSNSVSIIRPRQLGITREIMLEGSPLEMTVAPNSKWVYVGNKDIGGLSVIDATINRVSGQILFGARPAGLAVVQ